MATYQELLSAAENDVLKQKARVAVIVAADVVRAEGTGVANHTARLAWAGRALRDPVGEGTRALWCALAQNKSAALSSIIAVDDATFQTVVNSAIDLLATE